MKITLEPTTLMITVNGTRCRVWQGTTERGVPIHAHIALVGVNRDQDAGELEAALQELAVPRVEIAEAYGDAAALGIGLNVRS